MEFDGTEYNPEHFHTPQEIEPVIDPWGGVHPVRTERFEDTTFMCPFCGRNVPGTIRYVEYKDGCNGSSSIISPSEHLCDGMQRAIDTNG